MPKREAPSVTPAESGKVEIGRAVPQESRTGLSLQAIHDAVD